MGKMRFRCGSLWKIPSDSAFGDIGIGNEVAEYRYLSMCPSPEGYWMFGSIGQSSRKGWKRTASQNFLATLYQREHYWEHNLLFIPWNSLPQLLLFGIGDLGLVRWNLPTPASRKTHHHDSVISINYRAFSSSLMYLSQSTVTRHSSSGIEGEASSSEFWMLIVIFFGLKLPIDVEIDQKKNGKRSSDNGNTPTSNFSSSSKNALQKAHAHSLLRLQSRWRPTGKTSDQM